MTDIEKISSIITALISRLSGIEEVLELTSVKGIGPARQAEIVKAIAAAGPAWTIADLPNFSGVEYSFDIPSLDSGKKQSHADMCQLVEFVLAADAKRSEASDLQTKKETLIADKKGLGVDHLQNRIDGLTKVIDDDKSDGKAKAEAIAKVKPLHVEITAKREEAADLQSQIDEIQIKQDKLNAQAEFVMQPLKKVAKRRMAKAYFLAKNPVEFQKFQSSLPNPAGKWAEAIWEAVKDYPQLLKELASLKEAKAEMVKAIKEVEDAKAEALAQAKAKAEAKAEYRRLRAEARKAEKIAAKMENKPVLSGLFVQDYAPKMISSFNSLVARWNEAVQLMQEGGSVESIGHAKIADLAMHFDGYSRRLVDFLEVAKGAKAIGQVESLTEKLMEIHTIIQSFFALIDVKMKDFANASVASFLFEGYLMAVQSDTIFAMKADQTASFVKVMVNQKLEPATNSNIRDRIEYCWQNKIDFSSESFVHNGIKFPELANVDHGLLKEMFDFTFDNVIYDKVSAKIASIEVEKAQELMRNHFKWEEAAKTYEAMPTLSFDDNAVPTVDRAYGSKSIVENHAQSLQIKVETTESTKGLAWIGRAAASKLNYALMASAGGGYTFLNTGALKVYSSISNSIVDAKAYIASLAGSACIKELTIESGLGVKVWVYCNEDGTPVMVDGKPKIKVNGNEGSHWHQIAGPHSRQFRIVAKSLMDYAEQVNAVQADLNAKFREWDLSQRSLVASAFFVQEVANNANTAITFDGFQTRNARQKTDIAAGRKAFGSFNKIWIVSRENYEAILSTTGGLSIEYWMRDIKRIMMELNGENIVVLPEIPGAGTILKHCLKYDKFEAKTTQKGSLYREFTVDSIEERLKWVRIFTGLHALQMQRSFSIKEIIEEAFERTAADGSFAKKAMDYVRSFENTGFILNSLSTTSRAWTESPTGEKAINDLRIMAFGGVDFATIRHEMEMAAEWPVYQGMDTVWGFSFDVSDSVKKEVIFVQKNRDNDRWAEEKASLLAEWPRLVAARLEQAVESKSFDVSKWLNAHSMSILGKGKSIPVNIETAFEWFDAKNPLDSQITKVKPSLVINALDGVKNGSFKGSLKSTVMGILKKHFHVVEQSSARPGDILKSKGFLFGETLTSSVMIMREMKVGKVGLTYQATEKAPTGLFGAGDGFISATKASSGEFKKYLGILPCGGKIDRRYLPQIPTKKLYDFLDYLDADWRKTTVQTSEVKPLQKFVTQSDSKSEKPLLVSSDGFIIDGHRRWLANPDSELSAIIVEMEAEEIISKAKSFDGVRYAELTRWEAITDFFKVADTKPLVNEAGQELSEFNIELDPTSPELPRNLYLKMIEAILRIEGPTLISKIKDNMKNSQDGEQFQVLMDVFANLQDSTKLSYKYLESLNSKLSDYVRGAVIKGKNVPVHVLDCIEDGTVILPSSWRTHMISDKETICLAWRYPIASATSVGLLKVIFSDDKRVKDALVSYGVDYSSYPEVIFLSTAQKTSYQYDDDGDTFGILLEPKFNSSTWSLDIARIENEIAGNPKDSENPTRALKNAWHSVKAWTVLAINHLERPDYVPMNVEMPDIETDNNKKAMQIVDIHGYCTKEFQTWSHMDGRGPVGLISDLFSVILSSGLKDEEFTRLACACGYILQHSIDSAKKEKLVIPAAILLQKVIYYNVDGKLEILPEVNNIVIAWNEAWAAMDLEKISQIEEYANTSFVWDISQQKMVKKEKDGDFAISWLPTVRTITENCKFLDQVLFFAPSTLLANMQPFAKQGTYGTFNLFGESVPVHPNLCDAADPTRYTAAHCLQVKTFTDGDGGRIEWRLLNDFRKVNLLKLLDLKSVSIKQKEKVNGKDVYKQYIVWPNKVDVDNFPGYFTEEMVADERSSYPNSVFKYVSRWALEMLLNGKAGLQKFAGQFDSDDNRVEKEKWAKAAQVWLPKQSAILSPYANKDYDQVTFIEQAENGRKTIVFGNDEARQAAIQFLYEEISYVESDSNKPVSAKMLNRLSNIQVERNMTVSEYIKLEGLDINRFKLNFIRFGKELGLYELNRDQYKPITPEMAARLKSISKNSPEYKELTKYQVDGEYYYWAPSMYVARIVRKVNELFEKEITKNGRKPENKWVIPFYNGKQHSLKDFFCWQEVPSWFVGTIDDWTATIIGCVIDEVTAYLVRKFQSYACELTEAILEEVKASEEELFAGKQLNHIKFNSMRADWNEKHIIMLGIPMVDCQCCETHLKSVVTAGIRKAKAPAGSHGAIYEKAKMDNGYVAQSLISAIKAQANKTVNEILEGKYTFENVEANSNFSKELITEYVTSFEPDHVKARFGITIQSQVEQFEEWDKHFSMLKLDHKSSFIGKLAAETIDAWWTLPQGLLLNNVLAYKYAQKLMKLTTEQKEAGESANVWMTLEEWNKHIGNDDNDPKPPTGGGSNKPTSSEATKAAAPSGAQPNGVKKVMVTGHRTDKITGNWDENHELVMWTKTEIKKALEMFLKLSKSQGFSLEAISGMALGTDTWFAQEAMKASLKVNCYIPCKGQTSKWNEASIAEYKRILSNPANSWRLIHDGPYSSNENCMRERNQAMVDDANGAIVVWNGDQKSGTGMTVEMIKAKNISFIWINPKTKEVKIVGAK